MSTPGAGRALSLASIHIYPMKAARAVDLAESVVEPWGLAGDRRWLLVDQDARFISQRERPALARVTVSYEAPAGSIRAGSIRAGSIRVCAPGWPDRRIAVPPPDAEQVKVAVWASVVPAVVADPGASEWFSAYLGVPVRLVYLDDPTKRPVDPEFGRDGDSVSFADGYPLLLTSTGSLDELGRWLTEAGDEPVPMTRFRPNVVVTGAPAWAEDHWRRIRLGDVCFRVVKPCGRCVVTTTDQVTGERGSQPLKMLGKRRRFGPQLVFGQNLIPDLDPGQDAVIRAGDPVEILDADCD